MATYEDIARDFNLWGTYVDPYGLMTEEDFDSMSFEDKIALLNRLFGEEEVQEEED